MHERAGDEVVAPENVGVRAAGQGLLENADQFEHHRVEVQVHHGRTFRGVAHLRGECGEVLPALAAIDIEVEVGVQERAQRAFDGGRVAGLAFIAIQRVEAAAAGDAGTPRENCLEQPPFVDEVVVHEGGVNTHLQRNIPQRHAVQPVFRKQILGSVQDLLERFRALLGLGAGFRFLGNTFRHGRKDYLLHGRMCRARSKNPKQRCRRQGGARRIQAGGGGAELRRPGQHHRYAASAESRRAS